MTQYTPDQLGAFIRAARRRLGVTQRELALTSGTGLRFIVELERGKATCQIGKMLAVLHTLGCRLEITPPAVENAAAAGADAQKRRGSAFRSSSPGKGVK